MIFETCQRHYKLLVGVLLIFYFLSFSHASALAHASDENSDPMSLTEANAKVIIEQQMSSQAAAKANRRAELAAMPAAAQRIIQKKNHQIIINRVTPPRLKTAPAPNFAERRKSRPLPPAEFEAPLAKQPQHQSISLSVTVFGEEYSKILWRKPRNQKERRKAPEEFEIWTNLNLNYLRPIGIFDRDNVVYSYMGFTSTITRKDEAWRRAQAKERGYDYNSRWQQSPVAFTEGNAEYVVVEGEERQIPPELYQQMDALFGHYLENEDRFKTEFMNNEALRKAREAYLKENPPEPKDVIINHWPVSEGVAR